MLLEGAKLIDKQSDINIINTDIITHSFAIFKLLSNLATDVT